ncbi:MULTISPECIES: MFS transporter [Bacillaceae]|uniref:MFS transporter n=1 Tax=Bacillus infantis TaxID=324767 RepID=A0A5D4SMN8_9BACI|nr:MULTISPECIES: MFS transporter [Bacillus]MCA1035419.1 MFS transporter [Bacillus infantis]MCP1159097.1 MFS transporter [Bacillus infantis]MDT0162721.1 MFS transporter [Bacillus sp. AG4(2022)]MDW2878078.1 MFS transporter [Bacillus infantis]TYS64695.1 MFS transporter [Bacillus infantis]
MEHVEKVVLKKSKKKAKEKKSQKNNDTHNQKWAVLSISSIPLVMTLGNSMLIPVLPVMERELGISSFQSSMIITVYSIVAIILIPLAGYLSDHIGRKKVIIPSLLIAAVGGLISGWASWKMADPYWLILIGRSLQGIGAAGGAPIVMPLVGDMFKNEEEVSSSLGVIETSNTFGKVLSPILGAFLAGFLWFLPFFAFPVFCAISILLMVLLVKTPEKRTEPIPFKAFFKKIKEIFKNNGKWLYAIFVAGIILMFVLFGVLFHLSDILEKQYDIKDVKKGLFLAIPLGALCLSSYITGKLIKENKSLMKWITFSGSILLAASVGILGFSTNLWFLMAMFAVGGIGIGVSLPCLDALITEGIEKEERGTISSLYSSMRFIGVAAGPPAVAIIVKQSDQLLFYILCGVSILAALAVLFAIKPDKKG